VKKVINFQDSIKEVEFNEQQRTITGFSRTLLHGVRFFRIMWCVFWNVEERTFASSAVHDSAADLTEPSSGWVMESSIYKIS
jgi:hypothetical protein